jgi:predicted nucleic acid-binding protein
MSSTAPHSVPLEAPIIVLDTNVVLDWMVFRNPVCTEFAARIDTGQLKWIVSADIQSELEHVLARGVGADFSPDVAGIRSTSHRLAVVVESAPPAGAAARMRCTDPDDQKFIDLALSHRARWLLSRDRAVLKLARRALPFGLHIVTPERWLVSVTAAR